MKVPKRSPSPKEKGSRGSATASLTAAEIEMEKVYDFWDEVNAFAAGETENALRHLALRFKKMLNADNIKWIAAVRVLHGAEAKQDPLLGWRLRANFDLIPDPPEYQRLIAPMYHRNNRLDPSFLIGHATLAQVAGAGKFRVHRMRDGWIPYREFSKSQHYKLHYTELGITDRMWISLPLNADTESIFLVDRSKIAGHFSKKEARLAGNIVRGLREFQRRLLLNRGLMIGENPLSPTHQRIVRKLLSGATEKEIAPALGLTPDTTHQYVREIYKRFGVKGRPALMALWLGA